MLEKKIKEISKEIFLKLRGVKKRIYRFYFSCKKNKYFYLFLTPLFFVTKKIYRTRLKLKASYIGSDRERKLRSIKVNPKLDAKQVGDLISSFKNNPGRQNNLNHFVSIVILNLNGLDHLKRLFKSLKENTKYPNYEIVVIDNGSSDGSIEFINKNEFDLPLKLIANKKNVSFSKGCNQGAREAKGDLLVFMNNDIQVFPGWLENFVDCYEKNKEKVGSIGAKLIYPSKKGFKFSNRIQHAGIKFEFDYLDNFYRPYNFGMGESIIDYQEEKKYSALTAALLLVSRDRFFKVGGFDEKYFYGYEDVDLGLKFHKAGYENIFCPKSCAFHYEFGTQNNDKKKSVLKRRRKNVEIFKKKWGAYLVRIIFKDLLGNKNFYSERKLSLHFVFDKKDDHFEKMFLEFKEIIEKNNWKFKIFKSKKGKFSRKLGMGADLVISFSSDVNPRHFNRMSPNLFKVAWIEDDYREWFQKEYLACFDLILASTSNLDENILEILKINIIVKKESIHENFLNIIAKIKEKNFGSKIAIKIPVTNWNEANSWGDYHFALSLEKFFKKKGWDVIVKALPDWDDDNDRDCLAVLVLRGLSFYETKPYHFNMMWNISHPDVVKNDEYESYDHVFIASRVWAEKVQNETKNVEVESLLQCTDGDVFKVPQEEDLIGIEKEKFLLVGNSRKEYRLSVKYAIENGFDVAVYGKLWEEFIDKKYIKGSYLNNKSLYKHYYLSDILLNDHWHDMAKKGFVSNRIFDGLASGAVVLSDYVDGVEKEDFYDFLNIYEDKEDFLNKANYILNNKTKCREKALMGSEMVLKNHTFEKRVDRFVEVINENCWM